MKAIAMVELLEEAEAEVRRLRRTNEVLQAKVDVLDFFACVLLTKPYQPTQSMAVDVGWKLREAVTKLKQEAVEANFPSLPPEDG